MSGDPERAARFAREAKTLASLQHANIASVYGYEEADGVRFLVMELVEGHDLHERMKAGPLPLDDAVDIATQIANGLEAAHDQSIVHRDLKPANVKVTPGGEVKILDFGLARAFLGDDNDDPNLSQSPTITAAMTSAGVILGTAAYMSPEQARGKPVDKRGDMWSFGVMLFEMLSGEQLFRGETVSDTLAAVLRAEPDFDELPSSTPQNVRRLLRRCLQRDPRLRLRSAGDAALELTQDDDVQPTAPVGVGAPRWVWPVVGVLAIALVASLVLRPGAPPTERAFSLHLDIAAPDNMPTSTVPPVLSPDGRWLAFAATDSLGRDITYLRSLERFTTEAVQKPRKWTATVKRGSVFLVTRFKTLRHPNHARHHPPRYRDTEHAEGTERYRFRARRRAVERRHYSIRTQLEFRSVCDGRVWRQGPPDNSSRFVAG